MEQKLQNLINKTITTLQKSGLDTDNQSVWAFLTSSYQLNKTEKEVVKGLLSL
jgi:hypothetical protein